MNVLDMIGLRTEFAFEAMEAGGYHTPVMPQEVIAYLRPCRGMLILDGTAGGGGHTELFLREGADVVAMDADGEAIAYCRERLSCFGDRLLLWKGKFEYAGRALDEIGFGLLDGALLDLGVSSHQLDTAERGFSFLRDGPLDMRMDRGLGVTAADLVNTACKEELEKIFREYGEEPRAALVAAWIVREREKKPFQTTGELVESVCRVLRHTGKRHPATRVFQALRIAVNDELGALRRGLEVVSDRLAPGGRLAVLSYHSLEDRIVKRFFKERSEEWVDRPEWPEPRRNPKREFRLLTPHPVDATDEEVETNPRSRSAKLRVVEKLKCKP